MVRLALVALLWLAPAALAQPTTVTVRSGEHSGFSRLVLTLPAPGNWRFGRTSTGYELRLDRHGIVYDLSSVFTFIRRDRLATLWSDPESGALVLGIGCACHAVAFAAQPTVIVIDIRDGPPVPGSGFEAAIDDAAAGPLPALTGRPALRPRTRPAALTAPLPPYDWKSPETGSGIRLAGFDDTALPAVRLREALVRQIGAATASGLVEVNSTIPQGAPAAAVSSAAQTESPRAPARAEAPENLRVSAATGGSSDPLAADGGACVADSVLDFLHDAREPGIGAVAALRSRVVGEFDRPDDGTAIALAEAYLALGFGAEALAVLDAFAVRDPARPVLETVARIVDGSGDGGLAGMAACDALVALWAVLDEPPPARGRPVATQAVARAFSSLPPALRTHLGPELADRLLAIGETATAHAVQAGLSRAPGDNGAALALVASRLSESVGEADIAEQILRAPASGNGPLAGTALVRMADLAIDQGNSPDEATRLALGALARERVGTPEGRAASRAYARSLAASGDYDAAFAAAEDDAVRREIWALLAARGPDAALMIHAARRQGAPELPRPMRAQIADRLLRLELPEVAAEWLDREATSDEARIRAARAALLSDDGRAALRALAGLETGEAARLRAEAAVLLGQTDEAAAAFSAAGLTDRAASARWRGQRWDDLGAMESAPLPDGSETLLAALAPAPGAEIDSQAPSLASTRAVMDGSRSVRAAIGRLLETVVVPPPSD